MRLPTAAFGAIALPSNEKYHTRFETRLKKTVSQRLPLG
jgi:hypothetical protein